CLSALSSFSCCYCDHRVLHSFPTRRSSDLSLFVRSERVFGSVCRRVGRRSTLRTACTRIQRRAPPNRRCEGHHGGGRLPIGRRGDRKSTRLNSSHVKISYAVFCLKKKRHH